MRIPFFRQIAWYLVAALFVIGIAPRVEAGLSPSEVIAMSQTDRASDMEKIQKVLEMKMVRERLSQLGLSEDEIQQRLHALSDQQMHKLALQVDDIKAGGDLDVVIALLVIAILVVLILMLMGKRVVVTQ